MSTTDVTHKHILFCILNWGLGHATRSYPIIQKWIEQGKKITIASDGLALQWLQHEFANSCDFLELPGYNVHYKNKNFALGMVLQFPKMISVIKKEAKILQTYATEYNIDLIVSDNRYGCFHPNIPSIMITHQLQLITDNKLQRFAFEKQVRRWLQPFQEIWVPDFEDYRLSGKLSQGDVHPNVKFIGALSRMQKIESQNDIDFLIVLSGPEPMRTQWEEELFEKYISTSQKIAVVRGTTESPTVDYPPSWVVHNLANKDITQSLFNRAECIIARSGYSTIMDIHVTESKAILIPTPGQPEQEYLAALHAPRS